VTLSNLRDLYQQVILEHYKKATAQGENNPQHRHRGKHNPSETSIELALQLNERVADVKYGVGHADRQMASG